MQATRARPADYGLTKAAYSVKETQSVLSVSHTTFYRLVDTGLLKAVKIGSKTVVYAADIASLLARLRGDESSVIADLLKKSMRHRKRESAT